MIWQSDLCANVQRRNLRHVITLFFLITDFFTHYKEAKLLHSMYLEHQDDSEILQKALDKYSTASRNLSRILIRNYILYDIPSIVMGIVICILV